MNHEYKEYTAIKTHAHKRERCQREQSLTEREGALHCALVPKRKAYKICFLWAFFFPFVRAIARVLCVATSVKSSAWASAKALDGAQAAWAAPKICPQKGKKGEKKARDGHSNNKRRRNKGGGGRTDDNQVFHGKGCT